MSASRSDPQPDDLLSIPQVAEIAKVDRKTAYLAVKQGRIPASRLGKRGWAIRRRDAEAYATRRVRMLEREAEKLRRSLPTAA